MLPLLYHLLEDRIGRISDWSLSINSTFHDNLITRRARMEVVFRCQVWFHRIGKETTRNEVHARRCFRFRVGVGRLRTGMCSFGRRAVFSLAYSRKFLRVTSDRFDFENFRGRFLRFTLDKGRGCWKRQQRL